MVEIIGLLRDTDVQEDVIKDTWKLPALTEGQAKLEARINSRIKGRSSPKVKSVAKEGEGDLPGQKIYQVIVESDR